MANLFQAWDEDIQALGAAKASDDQIEARRQQLAEHFKAKAKAAGLSSKKIYETLDQFDAYSRQKTTAQDDQLTPEEQEMAQRVKDGTVGAGAMKEVGKRFKDVGLGVVSSLTRMGGDVAQTINDVSDNDKTTLSGQAAQGLYNATDDIRSNYSQGTKTAKKDFWSPEGLTMGVAENLGQIAGTAALLGTGGALAGAAGVTSKAGKLLAMGTMAAPLAYSQGYGQGKESSLDEINKTSNAQLWENVKAEAKAYDDAGGTGEVPYLVGMFKEAGGDLNLMKDLMAENAGNRSGIMTVGTEPLAMGVGSLMSRGAAAGGKGFRAGLVNAMNNQGMSNELARRIAAGASAAEARKAGQIVGTTALRDNAAIASQAGKIAATQMAREGVQETAQEGLEGYYAKGEGSRAAGRKGELNSADWSGENGIVQQGLQGGAIGLLMGAGGAGATLRNSSKLALEKNGLPEKHDAALVAKEQADAVLVQAANIADADPENIDAQNAYAKALDAALVATNDLDQLTGKFNALYTPEEQAVIKAATMEGVAARKKVADDAAKAQKELDDAQAKEQADIAAQQAEAIKAQRDAVVNNLAGMVGDDVALSNAVADLGLSEEEANSLLDDAHKVAKKQKKAEQDAIAATKKAEALKAKESEAKTQAEQKKIAFNRDMADLYAANPDRNPTKAELDSVGKKHGVKSPIELAQAWVKAKNEAKAAKEAAPKLALPSPETATKDERDITVPTGMNINRDNIENSDKEPIIVRNDGKPFQTQEAAEQAIKNKSTKKPRKNEAPITPETHEVIPVDGGFAIAPVVEIQQPKKPDDNEDGGVIADAPKPNAPVSPAGQQAVSPTGEQVVDVAPTKPVEDDGIKTKNIKQPKPADKTVYPHRDDLLTAIAKMKGLNKAQAIYHGIKDSLELNKRGRSLLGVFKDDGEGFDVVARKLSDMGYPVNEGGNTPYDNINGTPTTDALLDALRKALFSEDVGTEEYILNKYAAQREADQKEAEEMERLFNGKGSSTWDEADALDNVSDAIVNDITNVISTVAPEKLSETLKEVSNEPIIETSGQAPNTKTEARSPKNGDAETAGTGKTGQQKSQSSTGQDSGIGLNPSFNLNAQTNEELAKRDADNKASEAKRQAQEKAAKDKAQADKEVSDFRLSGSNAPADIAMAGGQKDMFAPPTRGEREAEKAQTGRKEAQQLADAIGVKIEKPSPIFETYKDALDWISEQSKKYASEKAFKATDLYKSVYEQVNLLYEQENLLYKQEKAKISAAKIKQMRDAGIDVGDKVKAFVVGSFLNGQTHYGVVVLRDGYPYVKLNEKVTVSSKGKLRDTSFVAWNDRWVKDAPTNTASVIIDEDKLKNLEISVNDFISANGLDPDNYDSMFVGETQEKTQYQVLINEMLDVAEKHIAAARSKFTSTPEQRKQKAKTLSTWTGAVDAIKLIAKNYENPFLTTLAARRDIPASLKTRFEKKFANLSDSEKYMQWEEQAKLSAIHRANKAIEWVLKEKSKEADNAIADKAQPQQSTSKPTPTASTSSSDLSDEEQQDKSAQNNEPAPTKQPETKTEPRRKIDFSSLTTESAVVDAWMSIKKGDIITTIVGGQLIAQTDFKNNPNMRFHRANGSEVASNIGAISGRPSAHIELAAKLKEQSKNELVKKLIGKTPEGNDLYEDGRGVRFTDNGRGVQVGEDVAITMQNGKTVYDVSGRTDEHRTVEEVAARQPKQPTKKESLLIKIDDELDAALDDLAAIFKEQGKRLSSGVDPVIMGKVLAIGIKASTLYLAKGAVKFSIWAENMITSLSSKGVSQDLVEPYLKGLYLASKAESSPEIRKQMDKEDDVYDFDFATLNENTLQDTQNVTTPSQANGTNARERDKTPQSSQAQGVSESGLTQDNPQKRDDGVSTNSGGRSDGRNNSNESGESETRSQQPNVASTRSKSPKLGDSTRSTESSDGTNLRNYRIQPNELKRTGSWKATAEQNVQIVELVKSIVAENRSATPEEKSLLTKFTGWGASEIANGIFPYNYGVYKDPAWEALGKRLEAALSPEEYAQAKRTTQYAHYTSEPIIRSVYAALSRFGFNGGSMVEPGMGVGLFNGLMPDAMANNSQYTGIEYDTITGNIAKLLYPDSNVIVGDFTQTKLPKNFFDVAVGNPPFGSIKIQSDPEYKKQGFLLHDYFFAKTIDRVKEGGLLVFVTSKGTMDKANDRARKYLSERADLVGAIRLPQTAFKDNAGTEVVTDVIFLRKRTAEQEPSGESWGGLKEITTPQGNASINEYFANHPEMILGKSALTGSMYRANEYTVEPIAGSDIETLFSEAINNLPENIYKPQQGSKAEQAAVQRRDYDPKIKKEGGIYVADDGVLMQVSNGQGTPLTQKQNSKHELVDLKPKEKEWLKDYVGVRDALKQAQYDQLQDNSNWQKSLDALNKAYDAFVKKHGFMLDHTISERENEDGSVTVTKRFKNKSIMGLDAESALINALEQINGDNSISKAPALSGRVINKPSTPVITSTQDAMFVVFNELGRFDLAKVAKLINKSEKEVIAELGDSIYEDPSQSWTTSDDYLSGNVVRKLKEAEQAARLNPKYQRNVTALKAVQPPALAPQDISVQLGGAWIPASDVTAFASEILSERFRVNYSPLTGQWSVEGNANYSSEWGIPAKNSKDILEAVLNNRQIKVTFLDANKKTHTDTEKTEKANDIAKKMRQSFKKWLWEDVSRTERLVTYYNEHFNNIAPRVFDGQHLTLPGVSSRFDLRPHQKRAIWRTIQQGDVYYAHAVGAGKTFTMIASGMEERRLGLVKKPMYVVPNHMLAQFSKEFLELYPMANIMVADEANFHTHNRRKFVAQAALNNPDAIVITHSAFGRIGMSSEYSSKFIKNQIDDWQIALQEVGSDERITRKQIERRIEQLENKLKALLDGEKDQLLNFEELGVDRLYVDEGHEFRKLDFPTNRGNIKGIDPSGSQKSMDLYMKVEYLRGKNPNRAVVMASGTPVTNTMGELFTIQRFFNPSQLDEDGDSSFDAWSGHYGEVVDGVEQNAAGGYETVSRFAKFVNLPELMSRVRYFMDVLTSSQLRDLVVVPKIKSGGRRTIVTPIPDGYKDYQKALEQRLKAIKNRKAPPKPGDDIVLNVITDGRFSAIDMRFVDSTLPSDPNSKLNKMLDDLISAYHETADNEYVTAGVVDENKGSSLIVFTKIGLGEQSAKNRGFDMKAWITQRLLEGGVKREHIAFMRDNKAHSKKEKLFEDMRQGKKRILIGGEDMETGVNIQKRLTHLFHLDSVWFPATIEQREGRIIRQGNQNTEIDIGAYVTKGSYDSTMWGIVSRKARFIEQAFRGDNSIRSIDDVSEASAFEMAAALASGDERYLKLAGLKGDVERLSRLYSAHIDEQKRFAREKAYLESQNKHSTSKIEQINEAIAKRKPIKAGEFLANVGKRSFDNREDFSKALFEKFKEIAESYKADEVELGSIAGFPIVYNGVELRGGNFAADLRVDLPIDVEPLAIFPIDPAYSVSGIATRAVNQTNALDKELVGRKSSIEQNTKDLARIGRRIGASFPEMSELSEKQQALNELEQELNAESKANDVVSATVDSDSQVNEDKPKFSRSTGLTTTQTRAILVKRFGEKLIKALEDKGILRIVDSVKSIADGALRSIKAYHGSPANFDKFMREFINSGEGAQAFGWGHYLAGRKALGEWYRTVLSNDFNRTSFIFRKDGERIKLNDLYTAPNFASRVSEKELVNLFKEYVLGDYDKRADTWQADTDPKYDALAKINQDILKYNENTSGYAELNAARQILEQYKAKKFSAQRTSTAHNKTGQLYEVEIAAKEESFLNWFAKFDDLSPTEQESLAKVFKEFDAYGNLETADKTIGQLYQKVTRYSREGTPKRLSQALKDLGYSGIKFLDQESRNRPYEKQYFNYVVFDESTITIKDKHYSQDANGVEGFYHNRQATLVSENLTPETVVATFIHELGGHKGFQELMTPTAYASLMRQFNRLVKQGNAVALAAKARAEAAESTLGEQQDEYLPYLLTQQATLNATRSQQSAVTKVIEQVYRAVKAWLYRTLSAKGYDGLASKLLQPKDITLLAERMIREMGNGTNPSNNTKAKGSQLSQLNTPQTQINAVRKKYEGTSQWMKAPNGQPTKLNEMQWLQVRTPNFKAWFGDWENDAKNASKVVDANGEPMVVYHGTRTKEKFTEFHTFTAGIFGAGAYFTVRKHEAGGYAKGGEIYEAFINVKSPLSLSDKAFMQNYFRPATQDEAISLGYDAVITTTGAEHKIDYVIAFEPTQIKSATSNTGEFNQTNPDIRFSRTEQNPRSSSLDNFIAKAIAEKAWLTTEQINLLNSATTFDELIPLLDKAWNQYFEAKKLKNNNSTKTAVGVDNIKSLIRSEVDSGHITKEHGDLALYFAEKNPALFDSLKSFSFQNDAETLSGNPVAGVYSVVDKAIRISRRTDGSPLTTAHEVLHHAEEFLPENIKSSIIKAWQNDLIRAFKSAENGSNRKTMLHAIIHSIAMGDMSAIEKAIDSMDGVIPANTYHLFNPSEYWAENASRLMNNRSKRQDTWIENARSWINGLIQTLKNALGLQNDAAILKGLRMVLSGSQLKEGGKGIDTDHVYNMKMLNLFSYIGKFNPDGAKKTKTSNEKYSRQSKNPIAEGIKSAANDAKNSLPDPIAKSIDNFMAGRRLPSSDMANITAKTELSIYKRTIGTQLNTALQLPDFKKVYDMAQRYLQHVAVDAYAALKVAPNLLGKLESWSDLKKDVKKIWPANFIKQKADRAAVASIIFDETLNNELLSDADILKALTRDQRQIYKEARDAIQVSLENTAKSEMVRKLLAAEAINWQTVESLINQDLPVGQFAQAIRDLVESRIGGFKNELEAILDADPKIKDALKTSHDKKLTPQTPAQKLTLKEARLTPEQMRTPAQKLAIEEAKATPNKKQQLTPEQKQELKKAKTLKAQIETTEEALKSLNDVENRLGTLIEQGYAPLMRFGEYTLTVRDLDGKVKSFFMFESKAEQVRATNAIVARYGKTVKLETDMISKEEFKQFAGMTPETVALFAKETGMDKDEAYQHYLKHAIPARSAMTRMIKRKGTEGFSDDIQRVVASFVMSNARMSAKNIYAAQIEKSIQAIESGKSVKDQAYVMKENVFNPKENFAQLRNFLFLWNLGGSIFFGLLNMTQPYMQTLPHLSQYVPIKEAFDAIIEGSGIAGSAMKNGTAPKGYEAEYNRAVREGVVDPQNVFMLSGVERGKTGASNSAWGVITHTMGLIAQVTESFNRKAVFIASLQVAKQKGDVWLKKKGFNSAYDFAKDTVDQTQGVYDKANRSNWANTSVGAPLMVFKQFSINYVEQMVRMWKKEAASGDEGKKAVFLMLALLASLSGMMGLPFIKDILDVSETTAAFLGNPVNIEREARLALGKDLADPLFNGVLNHFVFNNLGMDIQGRTGMPDLVPWSNALNPTLSAQGRINEFASIAGATGGLIEKGYDATQLIARGNIGTAALTLMPRSITSAFTGGKMAVTDEVMDSKGNKLFDTTWDEGLVKFIDANPKRMADLSRTKSLEWKDKSIQAYMTTNFKQKIIAAMMDNDQAEVQNLMKKVQEWNTSRPKYPVFINLNTLSKNANKKEQTFDARESIPKGMDWMKNERPEM